MRTINGCINEKVWFYLAGEVVANSSSNKLKKRA